MLYATLEKQSVMGNINMNNKELTKKYKQTIRPMGIYQIKNTKNGKIYIASAKNLQGAINRNKFQLKNNLHPNKEMQNDFNEVGEEGFSFDILDYLKPKEDPHYDYAEDLKMLEDMWMEKLQGTKCMYNGYGRD